MCQFPHRLLTPKESGPEQSWETKFKDTEVAFFWWGPTQEQFSTLSYIPTKSPRKSWGFQRGRSVESKMVGTEHCSCQFFYSFHTWQWGHVPHQQCRSMTLCHFLSWKIKSKTRSPKIYSYLVEEREFNLFNPIKCQRLIFIFRWSRKGM